MTALHDHLKTGATTIARAWDVTCQNGKVLAFTDHDRDLSFDGKTYLASSALSASDVEARLGLETDNGAVAGALQNAAISEDDILNGVFDDADIKSWIVNWSDVSQREITFAGFIGTIEISDGQFTAELRSNSERLNQPLGRRYLRNCAVELGSAPCGVDLNDPSFFATAEILDVSFPDVSLSLDGEFAADWFLEGVAEIDGRPWRIVRDTIDAGSRRISIPDFRGSGLSVGDQITLRAGCDKRAETCRAKFDNMLNFQGFPFIPGEDSALATPKSGGGN